MRVISKSKIVTILSLIATCTLSCIISGCAAASSDGHLTDKETGSKNELNQQEIAYFNKEFDGKYTIIKQLGETGAKTSAYLMKDKKENKYVLKIPNSESSVKKWLEDQNKTMEMVKDYLSDYNGVANIPQYIKVGKNYVIEKYLGEDLTLDLYNSLSNDEKDKIAKDIASFLVYLHNKKPENNVIKELDLCKNIDKIANHIKKWQTEEEQKDLLKKIEEFKTRDTSDEICVLTHRDIRGQNVLYDKDTKKVAIIDFEELKYDNIYNDFVPFAAASFLLDYELLFNIIDYYNESSNHKVSKEKIKLLHELGIWDEYVRYSINIFEEKYLPEDSFGYGKESIQQLNRAYEDSINKK